MANFVASLFLCFCVSFLVPTVEGAFDADSVDRFMRQVTSCHGHNPGVIVSVVKDGQVLFSRGYGVTDVERRNPVDNSTVFNVASLSKNMAAALFVKLLYTNTNLTVNSPIHDLLGDEFKMADDTRSNEMTFADVLGHRTGVPPNNFIRFDNTLTRRNLLLHLQNLTLPDHDQFRVKYYYNNLMYGLVTYMTEVLGGGAKWEDLITTHFMNPLGMHSTTFVTRVDYSRNDVAWPYALKDGNLVRVPFEHSRRWGLLAGSVALATTADDMTKWMNFHLSGGKDRQGQRLLSEDQFAELYKPRMALPAPTLSKFRRPGTPYTVSRNTYSFGLRRGFYRGYKRMSHSGSNHGFRALMSLFPTERLGVFMALNGKDDGYQFRYPVNLHLTDLALGLTTWINSSTACSYPQPWLPAVKPVMVNATDSWAKEHANFPLVYNTTYYEGKYYHAAYGNLTVEYNSTLDGLVLTYGWATWLLIPRQEAGGRELFFVKGIELTVAYDRDPLTFVRRGARMERIIATGFEENDPPVFVLWSVYSDMVRESANSSTVNLRVLNQFCVIVCLSVNLLRGLL